jgi:hypothetical protein
MSTQQTVPRLPQTAQVILQRPFAPKGRFALSPPLLSWPTATANAYLLGPPSKFECNNARRSFTHALWKTIRNNCPQLRVLILTP